MTGLDALAVGGGVTDPVDARHAVGGLLAVQGPTLLDIRTGVLIGPGSTALLVGTSDTGQMTITVNPHVLVSSRGTANGPYLGPTLNASTKVNIDPAPGTGSRIDVVYAKQQDGNSGVPSPDVTTAPLYGVLKGNSSTGTPVKPDLSTIVGATELGTVQVSAGATSTNGSGVTITNTARQTVARGADIPVGSQTERDALTKYVGLAVKRLDDGGRVERWTGSAWAAPSDVPVLADIAARNAYFTGNLRPGASALVAGNQHVYDGAAWRFDLSGSAAGTTDGAGILTFPHGAGQTPRDWLVTIPGQATDAIIQVLKLVTWGKDATNLQVRAVRTDTSAYFPTQPINVSWFARF